MGYGQQHQMYWGYGMTTLSLVMTVLLLTLGALTLTVFVGGKKDTITETNTKNVGILAVAITPIAIGLCVWGYISLYKLNKLYLKAKMNDSCKDCAQRCNLLNHEEKPNPQAQPITQPVAMHPVTTKAPESYSGDDFSTFF